MEQQGENQSQAIYCEVTGRIENQDTRDLWHQLKSELTRQGGGPDACIAYLDGELTRIKEQVERSLDWLSENRGDK